MKRKTGIGLAFFCLLLFSGWSYLDLVFASDHQFKNTANGFYELAEQTNIDVLFLGSSHIYTAVNPHIINKHAKTISYNLGTDGMQDLAGEPDPVLERAAVVVLAHVSGGRHERPEQVAVRCVQFQHIEAGVVGAPGRLAIGGLETFQRIVAHRQRRVLG